MYNGVILNLCHRKLNAVFGSTMFRYFFILQFKYKNSKAKNIKAYRLTSKGSLRRACMTNEGVL